MKQKLFEESVAANGNVAVPNEAIVKVYGTGNMSVKIGDIDHEGNVTLSRTTYTSGNEAFYRVEKLADGTFIVSDILVSSSSYSQVSGKTTIITNDKKAPVFNLGAAGVVVVYEL